MVAHQKNVSRQSQKIFSLESDGKSADKISHLKQLIQKQTHKLKKTNTTLHTSESTLRSFYESAPLIIKIIKLPTDNSNIMHIYDNPTTNQFFNHPQRS